MPHKIGMVGLGCPKNQVDGEIMLNLLREGGYEICADENECEAIIVNTCGFIEDAKKEAIENILELGQLKKQGKLKAIIVTGCLAERYREEILSEMPEVDAAVGIGSNKNICGIVKAALEGCPYSEFADKSELMLSGGRIATQGSFSQYLKIADGCDNCCTYCAIPMIRGRYRSRKIEDIIDEANALVNAGAKELVLVAQDTTRYGIDLYGRLMLPELLDKLCEIDNLRWIRILYTYPDKITDELLDTMARQEKVLNYLDIPLQHASGRVLKAMNRTGDKESLLELIAKIRRKLPDVVIRTTLIVGFPGETEEDFDMLGEFVKTARFDRMGSFIYSPEEGTPAAEFDNQIDDETKRRRQEIIMTLQETVNEELANLRLDTELDVLVEGYDRLNKCYYGRSYADAPDIDGKVFFMSPDKAYQPGDMVRVKIFDLIGYDLLGDII